MRKGYFYFLVILIVLPTLFISNRIHDLRSTSQQIADKKLTVYTSIYPIYDFASRIAGPGVKVINVLPPGTEPHSFQPTARLITQIGAAHLFLYNGLGMEPYLEKLKHALQTGSVLPVDTSPGVVLIYNEANNETENHGHGAVDPHIWLSPANAAIQGYNILQALIQIDPAHEREYQANYLEFQEELAELDKEYRTVLGKCSKTTFLVSHAAFGYLARDYHLQQVSAAGLNSEAEPTPGKISEIIELAKKNQISCIFYESFSSPKVSEVISREIKARTLMLHPLGNLSVREAEEGADYFGIMRSNLENLKIGLEYCSE